MNAKSTRLHRKSSARSTEHREMGGNTVARLAAAREQALAGFHGAPAWSAAWPGLGVRCYRTAIEGVRYALPLAVLILGLIGIVYWQTGNGRSNELADLDARLLTDELPIDAYLDKGFDSWLKRQSR